MGSLMRGLFLTIVATLSACNAPCDPSRLDPGWIEARVGGRDWIGGTTTWTLAGSSLQINSVSAGGWFVSFVVQAASDGAPIADALDEGAFPIAIRLEPTGDGGWATMYPDTGSSFSTRLGEGGTMTVEAYDGAELQACFDFHAMSNDDDDLDVTRGQLRAVAL